jgi:hypothetical protein
MALAKLYPNPEKTAPGKRARVTTLLESKSVSAAQLSQARTILAHSPELAEDVLRDIVPFDDAFKRVKVAREQSSSIEARRDRLRKEAPDLAGLVDDERMSENEAIAALDERKRKDVLALKSAMRHAIHDEIVASNGLLHKAPRRRLLVTLGQGPGASSLDCSGGGSILRGQRRAGNREQDCHYERIFHGHLHGSGDRPIDHSCAPPNCWWSLRRGRKRSSTSRDWCSSPRSD